MADQSAPDFRELLRTTTSDNVERPRSLPKGHYHGFIMSHEFGRSSKKQTPFVQFNLKVDGPADDVSAEQVEGIDFGRKELRLQRYITPKALYMLTDTLDQVLGKDGRVADERIPDMDNQKVLIETEPQLDDEGNETGFNNVIDIVKDA